MTSGMLDRISFIQTGRRRRQLAALCAAALLAAGCATTQDADGPAGTRAEFGEVRPGPSADRVIGGIAELVITNRIWPSFEAARDNPVAVVTDGMPLYAYIRANRPLGDPAPPAAPGASYTITEYPHMHLPGGDTESL